MSTLLRLAADQANTLDCRPRAERIRDLLAVTEAAEHEHEQREQRLLEQYLAPLLEAGFSGIITDKKGRKLTYRDGKRVAGTKPAPAQKGKGKPKAKAVDHAAVHARVQKAAASVRNAVARNQAKLGASGGAVKTAKAALVKATKSGNAKAIKSARDKLYLATQRHQRLQAEAKKLKASVVAHSRLEKLTAANLGQQKTAPAPTKPATPQPAPDTPEEDDYRYSGNNQARLGISTPYQGPGTLRVTRADLDRIDKEQAAKGKPPIGRRILKALIDWGLLERGDAWKPEMGGQGMPRGRKRKRRLMEAIREKKFTGAIRGKSGRVYRFVNGRLVSSK